MILNLTQHKTSKEQLAVGVVEPLNKAYIQELLTFTTLPSSADIKARAEALADACEDHVAVMVAGVGYLLTVLEPILKARGIQVLHSFSERRSTEFTNEAGEVIKTMAFVHIGWVKT